MASLQTHRKTSGFTLIELLVVIAIIGLLSSIVLASLNTARSKGNDVAREADLSSIRTALELYYHDHGAYPISDCISSPWWNCWGSSGEPRLLPSTYIATMPQDPKFNDDGSACNTNDSGSRLFGYWSDNGQRYILGTHLETAPNSNNPYYWTSSMGSYGCVSGFANYAIRVGL